MTGLRVRNIDKSHFVCQVALGIEAWIHNTVSDYTVKVDRHTSDAWNVNILYYRRPPYKHYTPHTIRCTPVRVYILGTAAGWDGGSQIDYNDPHFFQLLRQYLFDGPLTTPRRTTTPVTVLDDPDF